MALTTKLELKLKTALSGTATDLAAAPATSVPLSFVIDLASGTGANQANAIFADRVTLGASATANLDLSGALTDPLGATVVFTKVKAVIVTAAVANTNNVNVTREATNGVPIFLALEDGVAVKPGGFFAIGDPTLGGYTVTAGTGDLLTFTNSGAGTGVTYDVFVIGTKA